MLDFALHLGYWNDLFWFVKVFVDMTIIYELRTADEPKVVSAYAHVRQA